MGLLFSTKRAWLPHLPSFWLYLFLFVDFVIFSAALAALYLHLVVTATSIEMDHPDNPEKLIKTEIKPCILYHAFLHEFNQLSGACLPPRQHQRWASHPVSSVVVYFLTCTYLHSIYCCTNVQMANGKGHSVSSILSS